MYGVGNASGVGTHIMPRVFRNSHNACPMRRRGSAVLEVAIAMPILIVLVMGMVEFGYFYHVKSVFVSAAREGARAGAPWNASRSDVETAVADVMRSAGISSANYVVTITNATGNSVSNLLTVSSGSRFDVTVTAQWNVLGNGLRPLGLMGSNKAVIATCSMNKEY